MLSSKISVEHGATASPDAPAYHSSADQETASPPVLGMLEAARVIATLTDILSTASTSVVLGVKSENSDPISEAIRRVLAHQAPLLIQREIVPGDPRTVEVFDVRSMVMDGGYAEACLNFREDSAIPESGMNYKDILERIGQWKKPIAITGTYILEPAEEE